MTHIISRELFRNNLTQFMESVKFTSAGKYISSPAFLYFLLGGCFIKRACMLFAVVVLLAGCQDSNSPTIQEPKNFETDSNVLTWRLEDKMQLPMPCIVGGSVLATFRINNSFVDIMEQYFDGDDCVMLVRWDDVVCRWVRLTPVVDSNLCGYSAEILDGGVVLFGTQFSFDPSDSTTATISEYTPGDNLQFVLQDCPGDSLSETYSYNNAPAPTVFKRSKFSTQEEVELMIAQVEAEKGLTDESIFGYGSTLYNNDDGERLLGLTGDESFAQWVYNLSDTGDLVVNTYKWGWTDWFSACALAKCLLGGGFANPVCSTCTVVSGGLLLAKAVVCVVDCDAWPEGL